MGFLLAKALIIGNNTKRIQIFHFCFILAFQNRCKELNAAGATTHLTVP